MKQLQWLTLSLVCFMLTLWLGSCASPWPPVVNLNFGGAGMVRSAMEEIEAVYQQDHPNVVINSIFAGSAVIRTAVERGEPFDGVFFADIAPLNQLKAQGLIVPESRKELLSTDIVLIALADSSVQVADFIELTNDRIKTVAIGNSDLAIGQYTHTILQHLEIESKIAAKAVVSKVDVREVLRSVEQGEAEVGITFLSEAKASSKVKVLAIAPADAYDPIRSGMAVVTASPYRQEMQQYLDFLSSDRALAIFERFGLHPLSS